MYKRIKKAIQHLPGGHHSDILIFIHYPFQSNKNSYLKRVRDALRNEGYNAFVWDDVSGTFRDKDVIRIACEVTAILLVIPEPTSNANRDHLVGAFLQDMKEPQTDRIFVYHDKDVDNQTMKKLGEEFRANFETYEDIDDLVSRFKPDLLGLIINNE